MNMNTELNTANKKFSVKDEFCVWNESGKTILENEINEEYVLPDYLPDIRKILLVKTDVYGSDVIANENMIEQSGEVVFSILYSGNDGKIRCISYRAPYSSSVAFENVYDESVLEYNTKLKNRSARALSPRKLSLKAKIVTDVSVKNKLCVSPRLTGHTSVEDEFSLERKTDVVDCINYINLTESDIRVSEDITFDGRSPIGEIISCVPELFVTECRYSQGKMTLKGTVRVTGLVMLAKEAEDEKEEYSSFEKNIPISHTFETELPGDNWDCTAKLELGAFEYGAGIDSYGESRIVEIDFVCRAKIMAMRNEDSVFTDDVYSTAYSYENTYKRMDTERLVKCVNTNVSVSGRSDDLKGDGEKIDRIIMNSAEAEMNEAKIENGKMIFSGECTVKSLTMSENGNYGNFEYSFPVKFEMPCEVDSDNYRYVCDCTVINSRASLDDNKINSNVEIGMNIYVADEVSRDAVETIAIDKTMPINRNGEKTVLLYYPDTNENLWDVAKKYSVSRNALASANAKIKGDTMPRVLVIPR
ncbi:MAG: DUF3794 domain-containing protein [Clostridia bacterium]|nr:DUF3794 domain-containing protein [Clostridia bacterium]